MRFALSLVLLLLAPGALGWVAGPDRPHHADLATLAAERLPAEMRALIERHRDEFRRGALDPDGQLEKDKDVHTFYHAYEPSDGGGGGVWRVRSSLHDAVLAIRAGDEAKAAYQLGFMTHFIADLSMPYHTGKDAYGHSTHEEMEHHAYDHAAEIAPSPGRAPQEVKDVEAYAISVAERSAAMWPRLAPHAEDWSPEAAAVLKEATTLAVDATSDLVLTAFLRADPARPEPAKDFADDMPVPREAEDLGWGRQQLLAAGAVLLLAASGAAYALWRKRSAAR